MKFKKNVHGLVWTLAILILINCMLPAAVHGAARKCEDALNKCLFVAAIVGSPIYDLFCFEGYVFCKKYLD